MGETYLNLDSVIAVSGHRCLFSCFPLISLSLGIPIFWHLDLLRPSSLDTASSPRPILLVRFTLDIFVLVSVCFNSMLFWDRKRTSKYHFILQSLHQVLPSIASYYRACTKYFPALLRTTKFAQSQSTSQYCFALQSLRKVLPSTTLEYTIQSFYWKTVFTQRSFHTKKFFLPEYFTQNRFYTARPDPGAKATKNTILKHFFWKEVWKENHQRQNGQKPADKSPSQPWCSNSNTIDGDSMVESWRCLESIINGPWLPHGFHDWKKTHLYTPPLWIQYIVHPYVHPRISFGIQWPFSHGIPKLSGTAMAAFRAGEASWLMMCWATTEATPFVELSFSWKDTILGAPMGKTPEKPWFSDWLLLLEMFRGCEERWILTQEFICFVWSIFAYFKVET